MTVHRLDPPAARRIAIRAQLLDAPRPADLLTVVRRLTLLQIDPTAAIAPSADLVAWSRLGQGYDPAELTRALERDGTLYECTGYIRPMEDLVLHLPEMRSRPHYPDAREWLEVNEPFRRDVLDRLEERGPLLSRDIPDTSVIPWRSTGWTGNRNVTQMLEFLSGRGEIAVAGRQGRQRLWDLAERVYPPDLPLLPAAEAARLRNERRLAALGIARARTVALPGEPADVGEVGEEAVVEGVPGTWRVDPRALGQPFTGRTALLSPFDRLVADRVRLGELFRFEYVLEMYKPKAKRRWGYFALPILHGDRLVGKLDATADRREGELRVHAVHEDVRFTTAMRTAVHAEIEALGGWLRLPVVLP